MNKKILLALHRATQLGMVAMAGVFLVSCSATTASSAISSQAQSTGSATQIVQVTDIQNNTVSAVAGTLSGGGSNPQNGQPPQPPSGENGEGKESPPEKPSGESSGNQAASPSAVAGASTNGKGGKPAAQKSSQESASSQDGSVSAVAGASTSKQENGAPGTPPEGGMGGQQFTAGTETITFTLTSSTIISLENGSSTGTGTQEDIKVGSVLEISLNPNNEATSVVVKNLSGSGTVSNGTAANTITETGTITGKTYTSSGKDENALRVDGATTTLKNITVDKNSGDSSSTENGDFYGANAGLLALNSANVTITGAKITTNAVNGNGIFSYGEGTVVTVKDSEIQTQQNNSGGLQTAGGGTMNAENLKITTQGASAAAIRSDRGGGTVQVTGGEYTTNGTGSPAIYSTANITVSDATLTAGASEGVVVEGENSVTLNNCTLTGNMQGTYGKGSSENIQNIMIYQSMSGDAEQGNASFSANGGSITAKNGDMFYVTNTSCDITLKNVKLEMADGNLLHIAGNDASRGWGTAGSNGGEATLTADSQTMQGAIEVDSISTLALTMQNKTTFTGTINSGGQAGEVDVILDGTSKWVLTGDSYITSFTGDTANIEANGFTLYVNGSALK